MQRWWLLAQDSSTVVWKLFTKLESVGSRFLRHHLAILPPIDRRSISPGRGFHAAFADFRKALPTACGKRLFSVEPFFFMRSSPGAVGRPQNYRRLTRFGPAVDRAWENVSRRNSLAKVVFLAPFGQAVMMQRGDRPVPEATVTSVNSPPVAGSPLQS
jgi:hypothetical protein